MAKVRARLEKKGGPADSSSDEEDEAEAEDAADEDGLETQTRTKENRQGGKGDAAGAAAGKDKKAAVPAKKIIPDKKQQFNDFSELQLSRPLLKALKELNFTRPTPVQSAVVPHALRGGDVLVSAVTGSGKTAAFLLPVLERLLYRCRGRASASWA